MQAEPTATEHVLAVAPPASDDLLPGELRDVLGRLFRRLRREHRFPLTQASVLGSLYRDGPRSIGELAVLESVRPQSMSQTICDLEAEGLIDRRPDATDGRRTQVGLTDKGRVEIDAMRAAGDDWLGKAIGDLTPAERQILRDAIPLLNRLIERA